MVNLSTYMVIVGIHMVHFAGVNIPSCWLFDHSPFSRVYFNYIYFMCVCVGDYILCNSRNKTV